MIVWGGDPDHFDSGGLYCAGGLAPALSINDVSISEPGVGIANVTFTVRLSRQSPFPTSMLFATRDGTARAGADYVARSGVLVIQPTVTTGSIVVPVRADSALFESPETFFVDLLDASSNVIVADRIGVGTIRDSFLPTGGFELSPDHARLRVGERVIYTMVWTVPEGEVWRDLKTIDLRVRHGHKTALWIRWDEAGNTSSLCRKNDHGGDDDDDRNEDADRGPGVRCTPGSRPAAPSCWRRRRRDSSWGRAASSVAAQRDAASP